MPSTPEDFVFRQPLAMRWSDFDMLRHVNNAKYLTFAEDARGDYTVQALGWDWSQDGCVVARASIEFIRPLLYTDKAFIYTRCTRLGSKSFDMETLITQENEGQPIQIAARLDCAMVMLNYKTGKTYPIPEHLREKILAFEKIRPEGA